MSHYTTYVLIPESFQKSEDIRAELDRMLAPFNENTEVPEYDAECHCVGRVAARAADKAADEQCGSMTELRESFTHRNTLDYPGRDASPEEIAAYSAAEDASDEAWQEHIRPHRDARARALAARADRQSPDPTCGFYTEDFHPDGAVIGARFDDRSGCGGSGTYRSTYNPQSKWDWWVVGGRWDGSIQGEDHSSRKDHREFYDGLSDGSGTELANNISGSDVLKKLIHKTRDRVPYSIITADGKWNARGEMGWFGMSGNETEADWPEQVIEILDAHTGHWVVALDLHI